MRKIITSSVLILLFSLFSGSVFAGKIEACENIKHNPAYKGLYGLCNAYWNANENAQDKILAKYTKKAGPVGPGMPGLEEPVPEPAICPCWPNGEIDIGLDTFDCQVDGDFMLAFYDGFLVQYGVGTLGNPNSCEYNNYDLSQFIVVPSPDLPDLLTDEELDVCAEELMARLAEDFGGCL